MKKTKLIIFNYLAIYCVVIILCLIFQWSVNCNYAFSDCSINTTKLNTILTTSAPIITPIFVIFSYFTWRDQEVYKASKEIIASLLTQANELYKAWNKSRQPIDSRFQAYCLKDILAMSDTILDNDELSRQEIKRIEDLFVLLSDLQFYVNHLHVINKNLDQTKINSEINTIENELGTYLNDLTTFQHKLISMKKNYINKVPEEAIIEICHKLDASSYPLGSIDDYKIKIESIFNRVQNEIIVLSDSI